MKHGIVTRFLLPLLVILCATTPVFAQNKVSLSNPTQVKNVLNAVNGGTGNSSPTAHQIPVAEGSSPFNFITPSTAGNCFISNGTSSDPSFQNCPGGVPVFPVTVTGVVNSGGIPCFTATTTEASSAILPANDFVLGSGAGACPTASFSTVPTTKGGTGIASPIAHAVPLAEGASIFNLASPGSSGGCFISNGASSDPSFQPCPGGTPTFPLTVAGTVNSGGIPCFTSTTVEASSSSFASGNFVQGGGVGGCPTASFSTVPSANGGTGVASPTVHTIPVAEGIGVFNFATPSTSGFCFLSNGVSSDPSFQPCPGGTPTFPLTVAGTVNSGGIAYFSSTTQESSSSILVLNALVVGGGAGGAPTTGNADFTYTVHTLIGNSSSIFDMSAASPTTGLVIPKAPGAAPTVDGTLSFNTTTHAHVWGSNGTTLVGAVAATGTNTATTCSNQVIIVISGVTTPTCSSVTNAMIASPINATNGGTGVASPTAHQVPISEGASNFTFISPSTSGFCLLSNGTSADPSFQNCPSGFTNPMTTLGDIIYENATPAATRLPGPTSPNGIPQILTDTPSGGLAVAETWSIPGVSVDAQTGTTYTIPVTDDAKFVTGSNSGATAWTGFTLANNYVFSFENINTGLITYTPASGTVNSNASQIIPNKWFGFHYTDNSNTFMPVMPTIQAFPNVGANAALTFTSATGAFGTLGSIVTGPGSSTNGDLASFNGTGGLTVQDSNIASANVVTSTVTLTANVLLKGNGSKTEALSDLQESSNLLNNLTTTQTWTISGGADASANSALGSLIIRGANETGAGGSSSTGGGVFIEGGKNAATNASSYAGSVEILPGLSTGATQGLQGLLLEMVSYVKGATVTQWNLQCESASMTVTDCGATPPSWLGIAETVNSNTAQVAIPGGQTLVNASAAVTLGHTVCAGSTAGAVTDSGGTSPCINSQGSTVGVVMATSGTWTLPDGTSFTASTTLPLIQLIAGSTASGSFGSSPPACTAGTAGGICFTEGTQFTNVAGTAGIYADSTAHELEVKTNGSSSAGILVRAQPSSIHLTGQTGSISTATLCPASAGACNVAGMYHIHISLYQSGTACTNNVTGGITPTLTWTDGNGTAHSAQGVPLEGNGSVTAVFGTMVWNTSTLGAWATGDVNVDTNGTVIQYTIGFNQCSVSGTATYAADFVATRLQ